MSLLKRQYGVAVGLSLKVTDSGELAPSFEFPLAGAAALNAGVKLARARSFSFTEKLAFKITEIRDRVDADPSMATCAPAETNLDGDLGIETLVTLGHSSESANPEHRDGEFGGEIAFTVTRNINSAGVAWSLASFVGPGNFGAVSRVNVDKLTFAFTPAATTKPDETDRARKYPDFPPMR